jgi:Fe-S-cluster containining protein
MLLSAEDIERLERKGYHKDFFAHFDKEGYALLRNLQKHCVFYDVGNQRCTVYHSRPSGCRLYPVVYDEQKGIVIDEICRAKSKMKEEQIARRGRKVLKLLEEIDAQAKSRCNLQ